MKVCVTYWGKDNKVNQTMSFDFKYCVSFFSMTACHNYTMCKITRIKKNTHADMQSETSHQYQQLSINILQRTSNSQPNIMIKRINIFIKHPLCTQEVCQAFHNSLKKILLFPFFTWGNWGSSRVSDVSNHTAGK